MKKIFSSKSSIDKSGIFAGENFKKGEFVVKLTGKYIKWKYNEKTDRQKCANWFGIKKDHWIDPDFPLSQINHSCDPNIGIKGRIMFYALRDIGKGEELTFDYSTAEEESDWQMKCKCKSKKCRKFVTSIMFLPDKVFRSYLPFIPTYFKKLYFKK